MRSGKNDTIISSLVRLFEGQVENIDSTDAQENLKAIEGLLFTLKNNLQLLTSMIADITTTEDAKSQDATLEA